ncbi:DUF1269 domain-containing protein [Paraburkholderia fungorum]|uniref:DUF1269 domain-containing protein n=1 Tax=Paraburkholderia fungorum TaxID=134537 RepID=UPI00402BB6F9
MKENTTSPYDIVISTFYDHHKVEAAVHKLMDGGFDMRNFSVVGKGYHTEEKIVGFYNTADRMKLWGKYWAFCGVLWGLLFGGVFLAHPVIGPVVVLGHLGVMVVSLIEGAVEGAVVVGSLTALGAALFNYGVQKDSVVKYETAVKGNGFLIVAHCSADEMARARAILQASGPTGLDLHKAVTPAAPA